MKVLYIGHYKEFGGWAQAATDYILALDSIGVDVVCRNVTLTQDKPISGRLRELERKDTQGCDYCIQHVLPHHLVGTAKFKKNIAILDSESPSIKHLPWLNHLQQMDSLWVPNTQAKTFLEQDNLGIPISVVPHTCDINKYTKKYQIPNIPQIQGKFVFYYIGDLNDRKNIESVVTCFHSEFETSEDVVLLLKVNKFSQSPEQLQKTVEEKLLNIKSSLRMYSDIRRYKKDIVISNRTNEDQICALHQCCHCFLCPSHGEAWSIPSFDAMAFGSTPICSDFGGPREFITDDDKTGKCVGGVYEVCKCSDAAFPDMFTGREYWFTPCEKQIRSQMRKYYEQYRENPIKHQTQMQAAGVQNARRFSYEVIGQQMKELLSKTTSTNVDGWENEGGQ